MLTKSISRAGVIARKHIPLLSTSRSKAGYEGDGRTRVEVLNQDQELGLMIDAYATYGFRLNNGITVLGPMAIFPRTVLSWQVTGSEDISPHSLRLFTLLQPKIDLLVIGMEVSGDHKQKDAIFLAARAAGLTAEILTTDHACPTFNFLTAEGRCVAGALIPPLSMAASEDDMLESALHYRNLYKNDGTL